jgi:hypothetical protein
VSRCVGLLAVLALAFVACSPSVTVSNGTGFPVRAIVGGEDGTRNVHLVSPGLTVNGDVPEGLYSVTVVPDAEWVTYAQGLRDRLQEHLADSPNLTPADVNEVVARLAEIAARLRAFERSAGSASCRGSVAADEIATAEIVVQPDGSLTVTCSGARRGD